MRVKKTDLKKMSAQNHIIMRLESTREIIYFVFRIHRCVTQIHQTKIILMRLKTLTPIMLAVAMISCEDSGKSENKSPDISDVRQKETTEMVARGKYLVTVAGCGDCHSPKTFTAQGPVLDTTKLLSGHPAGSALPPLDANVTKPGQWASMSPDVTAFAGPWGISYSANLTPDSATGIGAWTQDVFINTLRTGKHLGQPNGRQILPPMPWYFVNKMTDDDLSAVYAYLQSLPPVRNQVPAPKAPNELQ
jgi:mono/diheme cytochrome c family protein